MPADKRLLCILTEKKKSEIGTTRVLDLVVIINAQWVSEIDGLGAGTFVCVFVIETQKMYLFMDKSDFGGGIFRWPWKQREYC